MPAISLHSLTVLFLALLMLAGSAQAAEEWVMLNSAVQGENKLVIVRQNHEAFQIEHGTGCAGLWRYRGRPVMIQSPGPFLTPGAEIVLPNEDQRCRIWDSKPLGYRPSADAETPADCRPGYWLQNIAPNGEMLILQDNSLWAVLPADQPELRFWQNGDAVWHCPAMLYNPRLRKAIRANRLR